jgi:hypothetical protein
VVVDVHRRIGDPDLDGHVPPSAVVPRHSKTPPDPIGISSGSSAEGDALVRLEVDGDVPFHPGHVQRLGASLHQEEDRCHGNQEDQRRDHGDR